MAVYAIYHINLVQSRAPNLPNVYEQQPVTPDSYRLKFEEAIADARYLYINRARIKS